MKPDPGSRLSLGHVTYKSRPLDHPSTAKAARAGLSLLKLRVRSLPSTLAPLAAGSPRCFFPATPLSLVGSWRRLRSFPGSLPVARQLSSSLLVSFPHHLRGISIGDEAVFQRRTGWIRFEESRQLAFLLAGAQLRYSIFRDSLDDGQGDGGWERHKGRVEKSPRGRGAWSLTHWCAIN